MIKRDGTDEPFDARKLAGAMLRVIPHAAPGACHAPQLALAIRAYLRRSEWLYVPSEAVFAMAVEVLNRCGMDASAEAFDAHRTRREQRRQEVRVLHEGGRITLWDKSWLSELAQRSWFVSAPTGRILAGQVEERLLAGGRRVVPRGEVLDMLNELVAHYGLADAVPLRLPAPRR